MSSSKSESFNFIFLFSFFMSFCLFSSFFKFFSDFIFSCMDKKRSDDFLKKLNKSTKMSSCKSNSKFNCVSLCSISKLSISDCFSNFINSLLFKINCFNLSCSFFSWAFFFSWFNFIISIILLI